MSWFRGEAVTRQGLCSVRECGRVRGSADFASFSQMPCAVSAFNIFLQARKPRAETPRDLSGMLASKREKGAGTHCCPSGRGKVDDKHGSAS